MNGKLSPSFPSQAGQWAALVVLGILVVLGWVLLVICEPIGPRRASWEYIAIGYLLGTVFSQTTLAAAWTALGPIRLLWRLPLSLAWMVGTLLAFTAGLGPPSGVLATIWLWPIGQWLAVQAPLWALALAWGLWIRHRDEPPLDYRLQFGIRQLMIVTAIVAVIFGVGRVVVATLADRISPQSLVGGESLVFIFLAVASIVITLPLVLATLVPRFAVLATVGVTLLIGLATAWELPLLAVVSTRGGPDQWHLAAINAFSVAWVLVVMGLVRMAGYGLAAPAR